MKKLAVVGLMAFAMGMTFAGDVVWTGATDGSWSNPANWNPRQVPGSGDVPVFDPGAEKSITVTLDTGALTSVSWLNVKSGTVTLKATEGSALRFTGAAADKGSGLTVQTGAELDLECPLDLNIRFDKWGYGTVRYRSKLVNSLKNSSYIGYGTNIFEQGSVTTFADVLSVSLGGDGKTPATVELTGNAQLTATALNLAASAKTCPTDFIVNGDEAAVTISGNVCIGAFQGNVVDQRVIVKKGTFTAGSVYVGYISPGALLVEGGTATTGDAHVGGSGSDKTRNLESFGRLEVAGGTLNVNTYLVLGDYTKADYRQTGGTANFADVLAGNYSSARPTFRLEGGRFVTPKFRRGLTDARGEMPIELAGGTFAATDSIELPDPLVVDGAAAIEVAAGKSVTLNRGMTFAEDAVLSKTGTGTLKFGASCDQLRGALDVVEGNLFVDANVNLSSPLGWTKPLGLTIRTGAVFQLYKVTSRLMMPVDLTIEEGGFLYMTNDSANDIYTRSLVNLHSYTYKGETKTDRGRIVASSTGAETGIKGYDASASVVLATVWTGAAGDNKWHTPGNWDTGIVPTGGAGSCADISAATEIVLDQDVSIGCLVYSPNGGNRKVKLTGDKKLYLCRNTGYEVGMFVAPGCELELDVDFRRGNDSVSALVGGGKITATKTWPGADGDGNPLISLDCDVELKGVTDLSLLDGKPNYKFFTIFSQSGDCKSMLTVGDGCNISAFSFRPSCNGYIAMDGLRQTGGKLTFDHDLIITRNNKTARIPFAYVMEGGELDVSLARITLGGSISSSWKRYCDGSFIMRGGTATARGITSCLHRNYAEVTGGTLYLMGENGVLNVDTSTAYWASGQTAQTDPPWKFGGARIVIENKVTPDSQASILYGDILLTGENGDTTFEANSKKNVAPTGTISGPGGLIKEGETTFNIAGPVRFTGKAEVHSGVLMISSEFNGPSALKVTGGTIDFASGATVLKSPETIELAASTSLEIANAETTLTVKRLTVAGVDYAPGEYVFKAGKVVVQRADGTWTGGASGNWSDTTWSVPPDGAASFMQPVDGGAVAINLDRAVSLGSLVCNMPGTASLTLAGDNALTLAADAVVTVASGNTLILDAVVKVGGKVHVTGGGTVVFNGGIAADAADPATVDVAPYWLIVESGAATVNCTVTGVRVNAGSTSAAHLPVLTLGAQAQVGANSMVFAANTFDLTNGVAGANYGEIRQTGGTVDYSAGLPSGMTGYRALTDPNGGAARYVLEDGTFTAGANTLSLFRNSGVTGLGTMEFVQDGGESEFGGQLLLARGSAVNILTLNGGTMNLGLFIAGAYKCSSTVNLNGGTVKTTLDGPFLGAPMRTLLGGTVSFAQTEASIASEISCDLEGTGSVVQKGPGRLVLSGRMMGTLVDATVEGGSLELKGASAPTGTLTIAAGAQLILGQGAADAFDGTCDLVVASRLGAPFVCDYDGLAVVKSLTVGGKERNAGYYDATLHRVEQSKACLQVLTGNGPGACILIR